MSGHIQCTLDRLAQTASEFSSTPEDRARLAQYACCFHDLVMIMIVAIAGEQSDQH